MNLTLFPGWGPWRRVKRTDPAARRLADRHYSRQTPGARDFMPPGRVFVLLTEDVRAVWGVVENWFRGERRWRVVIFRNEGSALSSDLIREATSLTYRYWLARWGLPGPLRTEVNPGKVRHKRDPGRCFLRAGWRVIGESRSHRHRGAIVLEAP